MKKAFPRPLLSRLLVRSTTVMALLFVACVLVGMAPHGAWAQDPGKPDGTVSMEVGRGGFILSASGGKGVLIFRGHRYPFKVGGLGVGGIGVSTMHAVGEVYRLKRIEDFPGGFFQARAGYAVGKGKSVQWLENSNGVILRLRSTDKGVSLNLGADGLVIEMGYIKNSKPRG